MKNWKMAMSGWVKRAGYIEKDNDVKEMEKEAGQEKRLKYKLTSRWRSTNKDEDLKPVWLPGQYVLSPPDYHLVWPGNRKKQTLDVPTCKQEMEAQVLCSTSPVEGINLQNKLECLQSRDSSNRRLSRKLQVKVLQH